MIDDQTLQRIVEFHGHMCPGLAMGIQVGQVATKEVGRNTRENPVLAVVETNLCPLDGIQYTTGCTMGMHAIVLRQWGKMGFSFYALKERRAIRVTPKPGAFEADPDYAEHTALMAKTRSGQATPEDQARFRELHLARSHRALEADPYDMWVVDEVEFAPPPIIQGHADQTCDACGEGVVEDCTRSHGGRTLCIPCFKGALAAA
jgi:formylmethanofuran dehydrogenase subunit E